jgi:ribonuclease HI
MQNLQDYPITDITDIKYSKRTDNLGTTKIFTSYKCKWTQPDNHNYMMWMNTNKVFPYNTPNITEHNLILLKQFYLAQQHKHSRNIIEQNFHQIQSKDTRYIHEPLQLPLVQINLNECNPDTDIDTAKPSIQIIQDKAFIYTNKGNHLITIPKTRLEWLWNHYTTNSTITQQLDPPRQPFETKIIWLYERYKYRIPKTDPLKKSHYTIPTETLDQIITIFNIKTSYFSSPLTCSTLVNTYYSPFQRDSVFGSKGTAFTHKWQDRGYAHPHNKENIQKAIHWACLAAKENQDTITILTIPDEEWTTNNIPYKTIFDDTHVIIYFPPDSITYTEPTIPPELNKEPRIETLAIRILCIHHKNTAINIPNLESNIRQITTKLQINPSYIITPPPTPNNTKVHKHPKWYKSPHPRQIHLPNAPQIPDFPHIYQTKFPPQYCYYTDGSFIPPKPQTNGIWDPAQAGYGIWNPVLKINLPQRLIGLQNILRAEMSAIHHTLQILIQEFPDEPAHIFTDSLNSLYLINTQIKHPTQQNNHLDKTMLASIVNMLKNRTAITHLHKVRAHTNIIRNEEADKLAKEGSKIVLVSDIPYQPYESAHSTPYWWYRDDDHPFKGPIRHLKSYLKKLEKEENEELAKTFDNINKWINNPLIDNKISNNFWTNPTITDAQITQLLKFRYDQYIGNARNIYSGVNSILT